MIDMQTGAAVMRESLCLKRGALVNIAVKLQE
jgi:hypothetical protein